MPLHNVIPLCNFKYVRGIYSGATFLYDTMGRISKNEGAKAVAIDRVTEIEKINAKLMYDEIREIDKGMGKRQLVLQVSEINIENNRELYRQTQDIEKSIEKDLELPQRELNKTEVFGLVNTELMRINIELGKRVQGSDSYDMTFAQNIKYLQMRDISGLNKVSAMSMDVDRSFKGYIDITHDKNLGVNPLNLIVKSDYVNLNGVDYRSIGRLNPNLFMEYHNKEIGKIEAIHNIDRIAEKEIIKDHTDKLYDRLIDQQFTKDSQRYIDDITMVDMSKDQSIRSIVNNVITLIDHYDSTINLSRICERELEKDKSKKLFYRSMTRDIDLMKPDHFMEPITIIQMSKPDNENYLDRITETDVFKINNGYLDRLHTTDVFKIQEKYADRIYRKDMFKLDSKGLNDIQITPIYKEFQKMILNLSIRDIYKNDLKGLSRSTKDIYIPHDNKFIDVTKRWWWLSDSSPKDRKIVPNRDYVKMKDLLSNPNYEYLRYNNHPIDWGKGWGIDYNIPPAAISIEIMLDITNIITMIWHKNVQGWLSLSGKEGIQLLMELLYDWYTMNTSNPNNSYYRAYRWVRWEAEKVYFLDTTSGLQAIGILVKNLREYLKWHHFNRVPIWKNPKAMDEERNFNRLAQNNDLMVDLNKIKGKRHYYIETQDLTKQNPIMQSKK